MTKKEKRRMFRAREGVEKGRLAKTFWWEGIVEFKPEGIIFRTSSSRLQYIRSGFLILSSIIVSFISSAVLWRWITTVLTQITPESWWLILAFISLAAAFVTWFFVGLALFYCFDFLIFPLQSRFSKESAIYELKEVRMGRYRHIIKASTVKETIPLNHEAGEVTLTVAATRRALTSALPEAFRQPSIKSEHKLQI